MELFNVIGRTYCLLGKATTIPYYKLDDRNIILLDSGSMGYDDEEIKKHILGNKLNVAAIICSHAHYDHVGLNSYFKKEHGAIIAVCGIEANLCESMQNLRTFFHKIPYSLLNKYYGSVICDVDIHINEFDNEIKLFGESFRIIFSPGHSPSHITIVTPDDAAYMGDAIMSKRSISFAKAPYAFTLSEDIKTKNMLKGLKAKKYIIAHSGVEDDIEALIDFNIQYILRRVNAFYEIIKNGMTLDEIIAEFCIKFNVKIKDRFYYAELYDLLLPYVQFMEETGRLSFYLSNNIPRYKRLN